MNATKKKPGERALFVCRLPAKLSRRLADHLHDERVHVEEIVSSVPSRMPKWATLLLYCVDMGDFRADAAAAKRVAEASGCRFGVVRADWTRTRENLVRAGVLPVRPDLTLVLEDEDEDNEDKETTMPVPAATPITSKKTMSPEELRAFLRTNAATPELRRVLVEEGERLERKALVDAAVEALDRLDQGALLDLAAALSQKQRDNLHAACGAAGVTA